MRIPRYHTVTNMIYTAFIAYAGIKYPNGVCNYLLINVKYFENLLENVIQVTSFYGSCVYNQDMSGLLSNEAERS